MFDCVAIRASDIAASRRFYRAVLPELGHELPGLADLGDGPLTASDLTVVAASATEPATRRLHLGLVAASPAHVDAFWSAGVEAGFASDGEPGARPEYRSDYYGAFLLDPDGNSVEAVTHGALRVGGLVDHLWVRVLNAGMTSRFLSATAGQAGYGSAAYALVAGDGDLARFRGLHGGSLTVVEAREPTVGLDLRIGGARFLDDDGRSLRLRNVAA